MVMIDFVAKGDKGTAAAAVVVVVVDVVVVVVVFGSQTKSSF